MSANKLRDLSSVTVERWQQWLTRGVLGMSGLGDEDQAKDAFEPYAGHIGRSREFTWIDELAKFILALDFGARRQLDEAVNAALKEVALQGLGKNWIAVLNLLDLLRSINAPHRSAGLVALAQVLTTNVPAIESGIRSRLASAALLAASEAEGRDRLGVRPAAVMLAQALLGTNEGRALREQILTRLVRMGIEPDELVRLGIANDVPQIQRELDLRQRFTVGHETYA